jgi:PIN domain nuclease of toxin-antitoxin system
VWIQRAAGEKLPALVEETLTRHSASLAIADISIWEVAKLVELKRLAIDVSLAAFYEMAISSELTVLPVTPAIAQQVVALEPSGFHKDPADQLIVATALVHGLRLISNDTRIKQWAGVPLLWGSSRG